MTHTLTVRDDTSRPCHCANCNWQGPEDDVLPYADFWSRVEPGEIIPAGDCPDCGAFCYLVEHPSEPANPERKVCPHCGGEARALAWAVWNTAAGDWTLGDIYEGDFWCTECGAELSDVETVPATKAEG